MLTLGRHAASPLSCALQHTSVPDHHTLKPSVTLQSAAPSSLATFRPHRFHASQHRWCPCRARRRVRYVEDDNEDEEQGHNQDLAMIEAYSAGARGEALLVRATVDREEETVLVFKGFSSLLSSGTSSDLARSVLPARAVVTSIDVVRGPFDPSNIEYLERGLTWEAFKSRILPRKP